MAVAPWLLPSGMMIFVDPATGQILERPRPEQLAALGALRVAQAATRGAERDRAIAALPRFAVPGGYGLNVEGFFLSSAVVHRDADGALSFGCLDPDHVHSPVHSRNDDDGATDAAPDVQAPARRGANPPVQ